MELMEKYTTTLETEFIDNFLLDCYQSSIEYGELVPDPHQKIIIEELQQIYSYLLIPQPSQVNSNIQLANFFPGNNKLTIKIPSLKRRKGLYLWGNAGCGKTYLVDYFYKLLPIEKKMRLRFDYFMQLVHKELNQLDNVTDPLQIVARNIAGKSRLLVLDDMYVKDVTDAMLLDRLFESLFNLGITLVTTSTIPPQSLYKDSLQRDHLLPVIRLLKRYTKVVKVESKETN